MGPVVTEPDTTNRRRQGHGDSVQLSRYSVPRPSRVDRHTAYHCTICAAGMSYDTTIQILPYHGLTGSPVASPSPHCTRTAIPPSIVLDRTWPTLHAPRSSIDHGQQQCRPKQHHTPGCRDSSGVGMHVRARMRCRFVPGSTILGPLHPGSCHQPISSVLCPRSASWAGFKRFSDRAYGAGPAVGYGRWTDHRVEKAAISCFSIGIDMMAKRD
jgi:hypothetical protein